MIQNMFDLAIAHSAESLDDFQHLWEEKMDNRTLRTVFVDTETEEAFSEPDEEGRRVLVIFDFDAQELFALFNQKQFFNNSVRSDVLLGFLNDMVQECSRRLRNDINPVARERIEKIGLLSSMCLARNLAEVEEEQEAEFKNRTVH